MHACKLVVIGNPNNTTVDTKLTLVWHVLIEEKRLVPTPTPLVVKNFYIDHMVEPYADRSARQQSAICSLHPQHPATNTYGDRQVLVVLVHNGSQRLTKASRSWDS
jgi:hypothetical protein